ncbi:hypothetical protein AFE02nite_02460 [Actinotalea fermentans]|uniref:Uncharacterized protein n=1 Tax=Actinotalea fermentans TaxID=43671 RepID=A0A511YTJ4_9CELL|nr:hypothetical protein AFE02nite_02460 [Actinotalea fermentans]
MNDQEQQRAARLGIEALNASLVRLGYPPVGKNADVRMVDPFLGVIPNAVIERPGVAPLRLLFGLELDIWVGPFSEVVAVPAREECRRDMENEITRILKSEVECRYRKRWVELILRIPDQNPWLRLRIVGTGRSSVLEPRYAPYASQ